MDDIGICQLCNRKDVDVRDASSQALNELTFLDIMESLMSRKFENLKICFKCQENAIIAQEFKLMCIQFSKDLEELEDMIAYEEEEEMLDLDCDDTTMSSDFDQAYEVNYEILNEYPNEPELQPTEVESINEEFIMEEEVVLDGTYEIIDGQYNCSTCGKFYKNRESLHRHAVRHKTKPRHMCSFCPRSFYFARDLNFHLKQHLEPIPEYKCDICSKNYSSSSALKKHMDLHTESKKFKCTFDGCNLVFARKFTMQNHLRTHNALDRPFKCTICKSAFNQKNILQRHLKTCHGEYFYKCDFCEKSFEKKFELRVHYTECDDFLKSRQ